MIYKEIDCIGTMYKEQNIQVTCEDEIDDFIYYDGFDSWEEAVNFFLDVTSDCVIVQLEAM